MHATNVHSSTGLRLLTLFAPLEITSSSSMKCNLEMALNVELVMLHRESMLKNSFVVIKYKPTLFFPRTSVNLLLNYDVYILNDVRYACSTENACVPFDFGQGHQ
jgi:hypothetical protein